MLAHLAFRHYNGPQMTRLLLLFWHVVTHRWTRYAAAWLMALGLAARLQYKAVHDFDSHATEPEKIRLDGNNGHTSIDFGGQWVMGRMLALGHGRTLYDRHRLYEVLQRAYPWEDESPATQRNLPGAPGHDSDELLGAFIDADVSELGYSDRQNHERTARQSF